ncbi:MAG TPA: helix-turn-helix domain-containing protein [Pyrinomonadaceae bacterium]|jgi:DNA-binding NtrC family response regulator|nr:helix-turn-helix domain-containing protein [Pyrinomonadaceae bacterium]
MQNNSEKNLSEEQSKIEISAAVNNRLEALKILTNSIQQHVAELQREEKVAVANRIDLSEEVSRYEADLIRCALLRTGGRQRAAARLLNVKISTLNAKIKRLGISVENISLS